MASELRHLRSGNLTFGTSPTKGTDMIGDESVVVPDPAKAKTLFDAVRRDAVPAGGRRRLRRRLRRPAQVEQCPAGGGHQLQARVGPPTPAASPSGVFMSVSSRQLFG